MKNNLKTSKKYIVKLNSTNKYFKVEYYLTSIKKVSFVESHEEATVFIQKETDKKPLIGFKNDHPKICIKSLQNFEFNFFLFCQGIKSKDVSVYRIN